MNKPSLTVLFITLNEEFHIGAAIDNVKDIAEKIYVVDSGSSDKTVEIAKAKGAEVVYHQFENFGAQWNFALSLPIATDWSMKMDPDERLSEELKRQIVEGVSDGNSHAGYEFDRVLWFMGKPMRGWKDRVIRVWKTGACRFTDVIVNEHPLIEGKVRYLSGRMDHLDSQNLHQWIEKQNKYTTQGAFARLSNAKEAAGAWLFGNRLQRRMWFKHVFFKLPGRYFLMFLQLYFGKGLWREGKTGYWCAIMRIWARQTVECKVIEGLNTKRAI